MPIYEFKCGCDFEPTYFTTYLTIAEYKEKIPCICKKENCFATSTRASNCCSAFCD